MCSSDLDYKFSLTGRNSLALLQNAQKFCYKMRVVTKCAEILLRNARCHKMRRNFVTKCALLQNAQKFCYEMRAFLHNAQLLQNAP